MLENYDIILASQSPRRQELLKGLDIEFRTLVIDGIDESYPNGLDIEDIVLHIAHNKAKAYDNVISDNTLVITADTIVCMDNEVMGKPSDEAEAVRMIERLSGRTHKVLTGVCIRTAEKESSFVSCTDVHFAEMNSDEIEYYVKKYKPMDKAGAYGIQEWIGYIGVEHISGSYFNVMGLPVQKLYTELKKF